MADNYFPKTKVIQSGDLLTTVAMDRSDIPQFKGIAKLYIIQLYLVEYKQRPKRVQISRGICTPEDRLDRFSRNAQVTNWIEITKNSLFVKTNFFSTFFLDRNP